MSTAADIPAVFPSAGMGTNVASTWDKVAKLLQEGSTKQPDSAEASTALVIVQHLVDKVCELPSPPKAVWKKLVLQLKVSFRHAMSLVLLADSAPASTAELSTRVPLNKQQQFAHPTLGVSTALFTCGMCACTLHQPGRPGGSCRLAVAAESLGACSQSCCCISSAYLRFASNLLELGLHVSSCLENVLQCSPTMCHRPT
jgi:hypothetical protein